MVRRSQHKLSMEEIRDKINARLGTRPLTKRELDFLIDETYIEDVQNNEMSIGAVVVELRRFRQTFVTSDEPQQVDAPKVLSREEAKAHPDSSFALSLILYEEATKDAEVRAFRTEVLADTLLERRMVPGWIERQAETDGKPTWWLGDIPVPLEYEREMLHWNTHPFDSSPLIIEIPANLRVKHISRRVLMYGGLDNWARAIPICVNGVLDRLRNLSEQLAQEYGWQEAQATMFVLAGDVPLVSPIEVTFKKKSRSFSFRQRIVLDVDSSVSPEEVAKHYRLARRGIKASRTGNLSEKHLRLATFNAERPDGETWAKKLEEWNRSERPDWSYGNDRRRFAHDSLQARRRLLRVEKE